MLRASLFVMMMALSTTAWADDDGWKPLFDGKTFDGWVQHGGDAKYTIEDGVVVGSSVPNTPNSFLCTKKEYGDFELIVEFKVDPTLNSGVQFRSEYAPEGETIKSAGKSIKGGKGGRVFGYQCEIDPSARAWSAGVYDEGRRGWLNDLKGNEKAQKAFKQNEWNEFRIVCKGDSIKTFINGVPAADLKDDATPKGLIALQVHGVGNKKEPVQVRWRNIKIKTLD